MSNNNSQVAKTNNNQIKQAKAPAIKDLVHNEAFIKKAQDMLGSKTQTFMTSVLSLVNSDKMFAECNSYELYNTCLMAASLSLPFDKNLGFAYIIPYKSKGVVHPQLQIGYKGFIQLAQRSGQFKRINATDVREGELVSTDRLTGENKWNWIENEAERMELPIIGYVGYIELNNGFAKEVYWPIEKIEAHAKRYSQSYAKYGSGVWKDEFDAMAKKTVIKLLLKTYAPLSVEMQQAIEADQADGDGNYVDRKQTIEVSGAEIGNSEETVVEGEVVEQTEETTEKEPEQQGLNLKQFEDALGGPVEEIKTKK